MTHLVMPPTTGPFALRREARIAMGEAIEQMSAETGYKFGPRGWAYYAEGLGLITKGEFDRFEKLLTDMRKDGELDPDVIEPDASRIATEVYDYEANGETPEEMAQAAIDDISDNLQTWVKSFHEFGYWDGLDCYVEMIVEKKDLVQIFKKTADLYRVRITNGKGDTDIHTRLAMLKRFRDHSEAGVVCPDRTDCEWCYHQRIGEWWELWFYNRESFFEAIAIEEELGYTFRTPGRDSWPVSLRELHEVFSTGKMPTISLNKMNRERMASGGCRGCTL